MPGGIGGSEVRVLENILHGFNRDTTKQDIRNETEQKLIELLTANPGINKSTFIERATILRHQRPNDCSEVRR